MLLLIHIYVIHDADDEGRTEKHKLINRYTAWKKDTISICTAHSVKHTPCDEEKRQAIRLENDDTKYEFAV